MRPDPRRRRDRRKFAPPRRWPRHICLSGLPRNPHRNWRSRAESNCGRRICNPLPNHLATGPWGENASDRRRTCKRQLPRDSGHFAAACVRSSSYAARPRVRQSEPPIVLVKIKKNIHFEFDQELVREPLLYKINRSFDVVVNIRGASVTDQGGFIALELEGLAVEVEKVIDYLRSQGVRLGEGLGSPER